MSNMLTLPGRASFFLVSLLTIFAVIGGQNALAKEPIRVGLTASLSGDLSAPGQDLLAGTQMWAHDINARGALLGRKVEIVHYDDTSDAATSVRLYERLITQDKVDLLLGPYGSGLTFAASSVAERHSFPMVSGSAAATEIWSRGYQNVFQVDAPAGDYMNLLIESAKGAGLRRVALTYAGAKFTREVAQGVREKISEHGMELVFDEEYEKDRTDFGDLIERMKATEPEIVIGGSYLVDSVALVREAKKQLFSPRAFAFTVGPALVEFGEALGPDAQGIMGVAAWMPSAHIPLAFDFSFRYKERYGRNAGVHAAYGYAAGQVLEAAVRLAGSLNKDAVRGQLREMQFNSQLGEYRVDETGKQRAKETFVMQWLDGRRRLVLPKALRERAIIYPFTPWSER